jgi:hypothetical protein
MGSDAVNLNQPLTASDPDRGNATSRSAIRNPQFAIRNPFVPLQFATPRGVSPLRQFTRLNLFFSDSNPPNRALCPANPHYDPDRSSPSEICPARHQGVRQLRVHLRLGEGPLPLDGKAPCGLRPQVHIKKRASALYRIRPSIQQIGLNPTDRRAFLPTDNSSTP